ncbi:MAG: hypothetical protein KME45_26750 [Stenomitos rutilans HA7619-LM2]|jgi:hypothetical protein|nr:hypothetical protein [Stenomitos rutilans HA7619-LM2]
MAEIFLFSGEKGGVGKSFVCRTAVQYHLDQAIPFVLFETDRSNPDVKRIYGHATGCRVSVFSEGEKYEDAANSIYNAALTSRVLVNLPAQAFIPLRQWIEANQLLDIAPADGVTFAIWFVCDGGYDSLKLLRQSLDYFGEAIPHIVVRNFGKCEDWEALDKDEGLQKLLKKYKARMIDFPKFIGNADRNHIDAESLTFGQARDYEGFGSISKQRVKRFLKEAYEAIGQAGVF